LDKDRRKGGGMEVWLKILAGKRKGKVLAIIITSSIA
jgi:hypothetical protein